MRKLHLKILIAIALLLFFAAKAGWQAAVILAATAAILQIIWRNNGMFMSVILTWLLLPSIGAHLYMTILFIQEELVGLGVQSMDQLSDAGLVLVYAKALLLSTSFFVIARIIWELITLVPTFIGKLVGMWNGLPD